MSNYHHDGGVDGNGNECEHCVIQERDNLLIKLDEALSQSETWRKEILVMEEDLRESLDKISDLHTDLDATVIRSYNLFEYAARWKALAKRLMSERDSAYRHDAEKAARNRYLHEEYHKLNKAWQDAAAEFYPDEPILTPEQLKSEISALREHCVIQ